MHADQPDPACVTRESLELLPASEWEVCTCKNSLHVRDILRLLYHGGSTVSDASRFYYARIDYMNRQRSWMRMTWLPGSVDKSLVHKQMGIWILHLFAFYDVWRGIHLRRTWRGS